MVPAYVINLPRSTERREHINSELASLGLEPVYVDAVDGRALSEEDLREYVDPRARSDSPGWLGRPTVIGCSLSHRNAWKEILDRGERSALVLEDDAILSADFGDGGAAADALGYAGAAECTPADAPD
jgi:glycosyl transferase family 25